MPNYFLVVTVFFYLNSDAWASEQLSTSPFVDPAIKAIATTAFSSSGTSAGKSATHYGIGYEQRMAIMNNQTRSIKNTIRSVQPVQKISRPVRPYRPQRPVRPGR
ncbi:MAG: hypothetical protein QM479_13955 [Pseudomonadota bacterium]